MGNHRNQKAPGPTVSADNRASSRPNHAQKLCPDGSRDDPLRRLAVWTRDQLVRTRRVIWPLFSQYVRRLDR
jgi:hypothetical protein